MTLRCVILLSGPLAVGKTAVRNQLVAQHRFSLIRSSQYLRDLATAAGSTLYRMSLQDAGDQLDIDTDYRWLIDDVALPAINASPEQDRWLVDAVRKERQIKHFRAAFNSAVIHVHLNAPEDILQARYSARQLTEGASTDPTPYEKAIDHDNERSARSLIGMADHSIDVADLTAVQIADLIVREIEARLLKPV